MLKKYWSIIIPSLFFIIAIVIILFCAITGIFDISKDILVVLLTAILSGFGWIIKNEFDKRREIERREHQIRVERDRLIFESSRQSYENLLQPFLDILIEGVENANWAEIRNQLLRASFDLNLFGSDIVIRAYNNFRQLGLQQPPNQIALLVEFARLLIAVRKTGFPDSNLTEENVLQSFIIDYNEYSEEIREYVLANPSNN